MAPTARIVKLSGKDEDPGIDGIERYPHSDEEDSQGEEAADSQEADGRMSDEDRMTPV
jgi:hypothetical protein